MQRIVATKSSDAWNYIEKLYFLMPRGVNTIAFNSVCENMGWRACEKGETSHWFEFSKQSLHWSESVWNKRSSALHVIGRFFSLYQAVYYNAVLISSKFVFLNDFKHSYSIGILECSPLSLTLLRASKESDNWYLFIVTRLGSKIFRIASNANLSWCVMSAQLGFSYWDEIDEWFLSILPRVGGLQV